MSKRLPFFVAVALAAFSFAQAQNDSGNAGRVLLPDGLTLKPHIYAHLEAGQIESGNYDDWGAINLNGGAGKYAFGHAWTEDMDVEIGFTSFYKEHLKLEASLGADLGFPYPMILTDAGHVATKYPSTGIYLDEAYAQYHLGRAESPWLMGEIGYFKFKYNPDVRNLGEYMFRTGTYPIYFNMGFDFPLARLLGIHLQSNLFNSLKLDALLSSSTLFPSMDWSASVLGSYDILALHFATIGAGVDCSDLLDVYTANSYPAFGGDPTSFHNSSRNYQYISSAGDTNNWYTSQGYKFMGRLSFAPQAFFKWKYLGENDLKLYAEADLIGSKDYPDTGYIGGQAVGCAPSYNNWKERTPVAVGFNFPTYPLFAYGVAPEMLLWKLEENYNVGHQLPTTVGCLLAGAALSWLQERYHVNSQLDVLNLELEYFGAKYYNSDNNVFVQNSNPLPYQAYNNSYYFDSPGAPTKSLVKWSVYAKKTLLNGHFAVAGQVGLDHTRMSNYSYDNLQLRSELLVTRDDWWWALKTSWMF